MAEKYGHPLNFSNQKYFLEQAKRFTDDPTSLEKDWLAFFQGVEFSNKSDTEPVTAPLQQAAPNDAKLLFLIEAYKRHGHLSAKFNPLEDPDGIHPLLQLDRYGLSQKDLNQVFPTFGYLPKEKALLGEVVERLQKIYMGPIGFECSHLDNVEMEDWLHDKVRDINGELNAADQESVLRELFKAKYLEDFLQKKFLGAKRFSLEGGESFMPIMHEIIDAAAENGCDSAVIGMAHRGRLNILTNLLGKPYTVLLQEFDAKTMPKLSTGMGDVKYHRGYSSVVTTRSGKKIKMDLAANPSHLESVDPVMLGKAKALQVQKGNASSVLPIMIHGDASVAGQGVVYESMQLSDIKGYSVGGTIHIVINNQIGFTAEPEESRSTRYCTDIAKGFGSPVFHVNGEDPAACLQAARLAFEVRHRFGVDVFIDMYCHRLYGHNEADEPRFTNPKVYKLIKERDHIYKAFRGRVESDKKVPMDRVEAIENDFKDELKGALAQVKSGEIDAEDPVYSKEKVNFDLVDTSVKMDDLLKYGKAISTIPKDFAAHPKIRKLVEERGVHVADDPEKPVIDWATAKSLAYASLVAEGKAVRISGQDSKRGTFSHRHAVLIDQELQATYCPLAHVKEGQGPFEVYSSALSEYAVMGYEFGYSLNSPNSLVIWEGQFGDFANGAQIVIDQYISSCETKWGETTTMTLFLPHGHEGMGPEHTSSRIERFLQLAGLNNWRVCNPSTPAQWFHLLRRQMHSPEKKPLIIATQKKMLRWGPSYSTLKEISTGPFEEIIQDDVEGPVKRVILCTGKIYYEMKKRQVESGVSGIQFIRVEQLYPLHVERLTKIFEVMKGIDDVVWMQEEPKNQGAWDFISPHLRKLLGVKLTYIGRPRNAVPDTGFAAVFVKEQAELIDKALMIDKASGSEGEK